MVRMVKRNQVIGSLIEAATVGYISYAGLPDHQRRAMRMRFWWLVQHAASYLAYKLGRISMIAELLYRKEIAGVM